MLVHDIDPDVVDFRAQPETFVWRENGREHRYTPDLRVIRANGAILYREVKPTERRDQNPTLDGRLPAINTQCAARRATFEFWTEAEIRCQPRLKNCARIRAATNFCTLENLLVVRSGLRRLGLPITVGRLQARVGANPAHLSTILGLVGFGELNIDLNVTIDVGTVLTLGRRA
jgi:hypothetical protein